MRWWVILILLVFGWFGYTLTPLWALYDLAEAVQRGDVAYVESHVNFRTLRLSLSRQLNTAIRDGSAEFDAKDRSRLNDAAAALTLPIVEALVTPQTVVDLLDDGWPQSLDIAAPTPTASVLGGLRIEHLRKLAGYYRASDMHGFRTVVVRIPPSKPPSEQFRIRLRVRDWSWRIIDIELNPALQRRITEKIAQRNKPKSPEAKAPSPPPEPPVPLRLGADP